MEKNSTAKEEIISEEMIQMVRPVKKYGISAFVVVFGIAIFIFLGGVIRFYLAAKETGEGIGKIAGRTVGTAVGSFDGITKGLAEGYGDGREQGLKAEDTDAKVVNEMASIGRLDVLVAQDQFTNKFEQGNDYKALFVYKAQAVFSVNLENADISVSENELQVVIPKPECEFEIDESESEKLAEWQKHFWSGSTEAGYIGYMNSMEQIRKKAASEMSNYDVLMQQAETSAKKQVEILVNSVTGNRYNVKVIFEGEEQKNG